MMEDHMIRYIALGATLVIATPAAANCNMYGNCYLTTPRLGGGADVYGFGNGGTWNSTIEPNGDQRGWDSRGNYWQYDNNTGNYFNYGTGQTCFGKGALRTCQ
jgi:hypothetical protein